VKFYKSYVQQYTKIIKIPTLQSYFSLKFIKIEAYTKPNDVWSLHFKLEVFIWRHVVYRQSRSTIFPGILFFVIFRARIPIESLYIEWNESALGKRRIKHGLQYAINYNVTRIFIGYRELSILQLTCLKTYEQIFKRYTCDIILMESTIYISWWDCDIRTPHPFNEIHLYLSILIWTESALGKRRIKHGLQYAINYNVTRIFIGYRELSILQLTCLKQCYIPTPNALVCKNQRSI
jgi:hypothetical protein